MTQTDIFQTLRHVRKNELPVIACAPLYPPVELLHSMGCTPVVLWGLATGIRSTPEADKHLQNFTCSVARHMTEFMLTHGDSLVDGLLMYNACDTLRNLPEILETGYRDAGNSLNLFHIHIPQIPLNGSNSGSFLRREITRLIRELETAYDIRFNPDNFRDSIQKYSRVRILADELEEMVAQGLLSFELFSDLMMSNHYLPVEDQISRLSSAKQLVGDPVPENGKQILISGIIPPPATVIKAMNDAGLTIAGNDIAAMKRSNGYTPATSDSPVVYYTDLYQNHYPCTTLLNTSERRLKMFSDIAGNSDIRGVIFIGEKFCEHEYFEFPFLEKLFEKKGIRTLILDIAINDEENTGQINTRIEAFSELLDTPVTA